MNPKWLRHINTVSGGNYWIPKLPKSTTKTQFKMPGAQDLSSTNKANQSMKKRPKWHQVYAHGTTEGEEERKFFIAISRNPQYRYRSVAQIAKEASLTKERVEELIEKYQKLDMLVSNPKNEEQWGYWERCLDHIIPKKKSISSVDKKSRIDKSLGK